MKSPCLFCILFVVLLLRSLSASGQFFQVMQSASNYTATPIYYGAVADSASRKALPGAVISIVSDYNGNMTVENIVTDDKGRFEFRRTRGYDNSRIEVSHLGYKLLKRPLVNRWENVDLGTMYLAPDVTQIDAIAVKARMEMYKVSGDTIIYFPKAVNTMEGDKAIEILRQMPGAEVKGDEVYILGKRVMRTYVNNRLIFGDGDNGDATAALNALEATAVASIAAYEEVDEESAIIHGEENAQKNMVLNVATFEKFDVSITGDLTAEGGVDLKKDINGEIKYRYNAAGNVRYDSEKANLRGGASIKNIPDGFIGLGSDLRIAEVSFGAYGRIDSLNKYNASFDYRNTRSMTASRKIEDYFPTSDFETRQRSESNDNVTNGQSISFGGGHNYSSHNTRINTSISTIFSKTRSTDHMLTGLIQDDVGLSSLARRGQNRGNSYNVSPRFSVSRRLANQNSLTFDVNANLNNGTSDEIRRDTLSEMQQTNISVYDIDVNNRNVSAGARLSYNINTSRLGSFSIGAEYDYRRAKNYRITVDDITGMIDSLQSDMDIDHTSSIGLSANYSMRKRNKFSLSAHVQYNLQRVNMVELLYGRNYDPRTYLVLSPLGVYLSYTPKTTSRYGMTVNIMQNAPSSRNITDLLDTSNPLSLFVGNPDLKKGTMYNGDLSAMFMKGSRTLSLNMGLTLNSNATMTNVRYFTTPTVLPEYGGYVAAAGAGLATPVNAGLSYRLTPRISYSNRLGFIRSIGNVSASYSYENPERMTNGAPERNIMQSYTLSASLTTNFSVKFRAQLSSSSMWRNTRTADFAHNEFHQTLTGSVRWDFVDRASFTSSYRADWVAGGAVAGNIDTHVLDFSLFYRVFRDRRGSIHLNAYNVLNRNSGYSTSVSDQYLLRQWQIINPCYVSIGFKYNLIKQK